MPRSSAACSEIDARTHVAAGRRARPLGKIGLASPALAGARGPAHGRYEMQASEIPADLAPCEACLGELADSASRRFRYPFINCAACGPRFTIARGAPFDRLATTMSAFVMCAECREEYDDPASRRFRAQPTACASCGPTVRLVERGETVFEGDRAIVGAAAAIAAGEIVALKGAGGFALAVDATNEAAVARLRTRKRRPHKPFAVMGRSLRELDRTAVLDASTRDALAAPGRPIVIVPLRLGSGLAQSIAPHLGDIGVCLPPTPLQHLLLGDGPPLQVMTSGNIAGEPIARTNEEAFARLGDVADVFLVHDHEVYARADDTVMRRAARHPIPIRRARGAVPESIALPIIGPAVLAVGGDESNTVCIAERGRAVLSQHVGDLSHPGADAFFTETIAHLRELVGTTPVAVAHDLHPDYRTTRWALESGLPRIAVQHHHAHVAACLVEHNRRDRVVGIAFDDGGLGDDGALWGGEILEADLEVSRRRGFLRPLAIVGADALRTEPWRLAIAALLDAGEPLDVLARTRELDRARIRGLLGTPLPIHSTAAACWFAAVAALLGAAHEVTYDGQASAQLEALAAPGPETNTAPPLPFAIVGDPFEIDLRPMVRELAHEIRRGVPTCVLAARFHATIAIAIRDARRRLGRRTVVLTGACFQNRRLLERTTALLESDDCEVLTHRRVPANDGGLALGQAAVATCRLAKR